MTSPFQLARFRPLLESPYAKYFIVAFGLLIRIIALVRIGGRFLYYENTAYDRMAVQLLHNVKFSPLFYACMCLTYLMVHAVEGLVARASILLVYVAFSFGLYALVRELWSRRAANIAVLVFVLYPSYIRWSFNPSTEYPAAACLVAIVWLTAVSIRKRSIAVAVTLGLLLGILTLVRGSSLGLFSDDARVCVLSDQEIHARACSSAHRSDSNLCLALESARDDRPVRHD